jgi:hypothetical protein
MSAREETFTIVHLGIRDDGLEDVVDEAARWAARHGVGSVARVEIWSSVSSRVMLGCAATASVYGAPVWHAMPRIEHLVEGLSARRIEARVRFGRRSVVRRAELRACASGWPLVYV